MIDIYSHLQSPSTFIKRSPSIHPSIQETTMVVSDLIGLLLEGNLIELMLIIFSYDDSTSIEGFFVYRLNPQTGSSKA